jgi:uncharacterized protein YciI
MHRSRTLVGVTTLTILLAAWASAPAQEPGAAQPATRPAAAAAGPQFEQYQLVILRAGDNPQQLPRERVQEIQKQHLAHMEQLAQQGKILVAGPFTDQPDKTMRGMCIYRCGSVDEARQLAEQDPAVVAGRLRVEVLTWNVEKGYMEFPKAPAGR